MFTYVRVLLIATVSSVRGCILIQVNKILIISIVILVGAVSFYIFSERKNVDAPVQDGPVVVFGDSLVAGVGASPKGDIASVLSSRLGATVINKGISGDTSGGALSRVDADVVKVEPSIVVIIIGGNDFLRRVPKAETLNNVRTIIEKIQTTGSRVVLVGIESLIYNNDYKSIAKEYNTEFIPNILGLTRGNTSLMSDSIHPNDAGYLLFADAIEEKIRAIKGGS